MPKNDLASDMLEGGGKALMDSKSLLLGLTPSGVISSPAKLTVSRPNWRNPVGSDFSAEMQIYQPGK